MKRDSAAAEDFLGLGQDDDSPAPDLSSEERDFWSLASPAIDDFDELGNSSFASDVGEGHNSQQESEVTPMMSGPNFDQEAHDVESGYGHLEDLNPSQNTSFLDDVAPDERFELESTGKDGSELSDESFSLDFSDANELEEESEEVSWLMEFDLEEEVDFSDTAADLIPATAELNESDELEFESELRGAAAARSPWLGRILVVAASIAIGVVGSKFVAQNGLWKPVEPRVAQTTPVQPPTQAPSSEVSPTASNTELSPGPIEVASAPPRVEPAPIEAPTPPVTQPEVEIQGNASQPVIETGPTTVEVAVEQPTDGVERRTQEQAADQVVPLPELKDPHLREASASEMAGMWLGATIPLEALTHPSRLLTPNVGRVRVVLLEGEAFEGQLYAIGQKKVWIETELGKMALLDWQIEHIEHIVDAEGMALVGGDRSKDIAGLKSVRVRTAGGVFYGRLVSHEGNTVTLALASGARITLEGAKVEMAGKTTSRLVDASGAIQDVVAEVPAEKK